MLTHFFFTIDDADFIQIYYDILKIFKKVYENDKK